MWRDPTERALMLLSVLSSRPTWTGAELAERLGTTTRTVRRDIDRLRRLDYQIDSFSGTAGRYQLRPGAAVPPLFLDGDEAIAVAAALLVAVSDQTTGMVDSSRRALVKLHQLLPPRLLRRVAAIDSVAQAVSLHSAPQVDPTVVASLAEACRDQMIVRFGYRSRLGDASDRRAEPVSLLTARSVWYLVAFDLDRDDWRLFRVDRMIDVTSTGHQTSRRRLPDGDPMKFFSRSLARTSYAHTAEITVDLAENELHERMPWINTERIHPETANGCVISLGADDIGALVGQVARVLALGRTREFQADDRTREHLRLISTELAFARRP